MTHLANLLLITVYAEKNSPCSKNAVLAARYEAALKKAIQEIEGGETGSAGTQDAGQPTQDAGQRTQDAGQPTQDAGQPTQGTGSVSMEEIRKIQREVLENYLKKIGVGDEMQTPRRVRGGNS